MVPSSALRETLVLVWWADTWLWEGKQGRSADAATCILPACRCGDQSSSRPCPCPLLSQPQLSLYSNQPRISTTARVSLHVMQKFPVSAFTPCFLSSLFQHYVVFVSFIQGQCFITCAQYRELTSSFHWAPFFFCGVFLIFDLPSDSAVGIPCCSADSGIRCVLLWFN